MIHLWISFVLHFLALIIISLNNNNAKKIEISGSEGKGNGVSAISIKIEDAIGNNKFEEKTEAVKIAPVVIPAAQKIIEQPIKKKKIEQTKKKEEVEKVIKENVLKVETKTKKKANSTDVKKSNQNSIENAKTTSPSNTKHLISNGVKNGIGTGPGKGNATGAGVGSGSGTALGAGASSSVDPISIAAGNIQARIMQYWFPPEEFSARKDILVTIEVFLDTQGFITSYKLIEPKDTPEYRAVAATVIRTINDPRVVPLPVENTKLRSIILTFCPRDLLE